MENVAGLLSELISFLLDFNFSENARWELS